MTESDFDALADLTTEARNLKSEDLDLLSPLELVRLINREDSQVADAVASQEEAIASAIEAVAARMGSGGRLIYMGAGTSGRLGVLDAAECPPTFNCDPGMVIGLIAGGEEGMVRAVEGAEDSREMGKRDLMGIGLDEHDAVVGITASGRTPYVLGGLDFARATGALTIGFSCNEQAEIRSYADLNIIPVVGPEVLSGSTRLKAGTATKMVLNMLSTGAMVLLGKTYSNLMVDLQASNMKLVNRAVRIIHQITQVSLEDAASALERSDGELKVAIMTIKLNESAEQARRKLKQANGRLRVALEAANYSRQVSEN